MSSPSSPPRLTVAILARDAEHLLPGTLSTALRLTQDVVVLDTGSSDGTCHVARAAGARVLEAPWQDDFAAARNQLWDNLTGQWILWLDAGEELSQADALALRAFVEASASPTKAYMLLVSVPAAPDSIAGEQIGSVRLVPNRRDVRYRGRLHERLDECLAAAKLAIEGLPWRIQRGAGEHAPGRKLARAQRNLHIVQVQIAEQGQIPQHLITLAGALCDLGDHASAVPCYRKAIHDALPGSRESREAYYGLLTALDNDPSQRELQVNICLEALAAFPLDAQLLCAMGGYLQAKSQNELAARAYETAFEFGSVDPSCWHVTEIQEIAAICRSVLAQLENDDHVARHTLERALERFPSFTRLRRHLIHVHIRADRRKEALEDVDRLGLDPAERNSLRSAVRGACLAAKQNWVPAVAYLQTAYGDGCRDLICLRWLAVALLSTGESASALPILHQWQALDPRSVEVQKYLAAIKTPALDEPQRTATDFRHVRIDPAAQSLGMEHLLPRSARASLPG